MPQDFISEAIEPVAGTADVTPMTRGEPGLPGKFRWRGDEYVVEEVLEQWKDADSRRGDGGQQYIRKHWYRIRTTGGEVMRLYFLRQPSSTKRQKSRWWLYTIESDRE